MPGFLLSSCRWDKDARKLGCARRVIGEQHAVQALCLSLKDTGVCRQDRSHHVLRGQKRRLHELGDIFTCKLAQTCCAFP